jgi:endonuclease/exonuclease/phosphatase (EEP) superfamily protein YafD
MISEAQVLRLLRLALAGLLGASLLAALAWLGWPFELFAHFRWQLGAAALTGTVIALSLRDGRLIALAACALVVQAVPILLSRHEPVPKAATTCTGPSFTIATVNLEFDNLEHGRAVHWLNEHPADVVVLQEVTRAWAQVLRHDVKGYNEGRLLTREDPYGIALLSRWPILRATPEDFARDGLPSFVVTVLVGERPVEVVGMHSHWPILPKLYVARNTALHEAAHAVRTAKVPVVLAGDLNLTPYAPAFGTLLRETGLADALHGLGWRPTWRASWPPLALPIDHVLVPSSACVTHAEIGPAIGSDHRPVRVTLRWP